MVSCTWWHEDMNFISKCKLKNNILQMTAASKILSVSVFTSRTSSSHKKVFYYNINMNASCLHKQLCTANYITDILTGEDVEVKDYVISCYNHPMRGDYSIILKH